VRPKDETPAPGNYEPHPPTSPGKNVVFGRAPSTPKISRDNSPGPGAYVSPEPSKPYVPGFKFGSPTKERLPPPKLESPGPGNYDLTPPKNLRGPTLRGRHESPIFKRAADSPGPGMYDYNPMARSVPAFKIGSSPRTDITKTGVYSPGPGGFTHKPEPPKGGRWSMAPKERPTRSDAPGPGSYEFPPIKDKGRAITMGSGRKPQKIPDGPGPGYAPMGLPPNEKKTPTFSWGTAPRQSPITTQKQSPGPGQYATAPNSPQGRGLSFGRSPRGSKKTPEYQGLMYNIPASYPNAPKYLMPGQLMSRYAEEPIN
jgi:hypothetical protein